MRKRKRRLLETLLLVGGLLAVDVWIWSHAIEAIFQRKDEQQFEREQITGEAKKQRPGGSRVGRLTIPRLHLRTMVREGTTEKVLTVAAGHIPNTALPGEPGNVGVAGHRDTLFRGLKDIHQNDLILFETLGGTYNYRVESTKIVKPEDVSVLRAGDSPELTLVTCYPFYYVGNAPQRFIVKARQVDDRRVEAAAESPQPAVRKRQHLNPRRAASRTSKKSKPKRLEVAAISRPDRVR